MADARKLLADVNGGQLGAGGWFYARTDAGRAGHVQCLGVFDERDLGTWSRRVLGGDGLVRRPSECWLDEAEAVLELLAQAQKDLVWKRQRAEEALALVDSLKLQAASVGVRMDGGPEVFPLDAHPQRKGGA